jgi:hypothetical protein
LLLVVLLMSTMKLAIIGLLFASFPFVFVVLGLYLLPQCTFVNFTATNIFFSTSDQINSVL